MSFVKGTLTIGKVVLTVTPNAASKTYGQGVKLTYTVTGLVNGDTSSAYHGAPTLSSAGTAGTAGVGNYPISASLGSLTSASYSFSFGPNATLTVNPATLTITASNKSATYGSALPAFTYTVSGLISSDTASTAFTGAPSLSSAASQGSGVGIYPITPVAGTLSSSNYTFAFAAGQLTINRAMLTITPLKTSAVYGSPLPTFNYVVTGFVNGDTALTALTGAPAITTTAVQGSPVGAYTITAATGKLSSKNYTFAFKTATLTITKATLTVTANNLSMVKGQPVPTLTYTITGLVNGDTSSVYSGTPALSTTATSKSPVGTYTITVKAGTLTTNNNYGFAFVNGKLTITPN